MTSNTFYTLAVFAIVLLIITKPIGLWLTPIAQGRAPAVVDAIDRRLISVLAPSGREESWQRYAVSLLTFNRKLFKTPIFERWGKQFCLN